MTGLRLNLGWMKQQPLPRITASCFLFVTCSVCSVCYRCEHGGTLSWQVPDADASDVVHIPQKDTGLHRDSRSSTISTGTVVFLAYWK